MSLIAIAGISLALFQPDTPNWNIDVALVFSAALSAIDPVPAIPILEESGTLVTVRRMSNYECLCNFI